jgi:hypothetical protein
MAIRTQHKESAMVMFHQSVSTPESVKSGSAVMSSGNACFYPGRLRQLRHGRCDVVTVQVCGASSG